jgi:hypothetical protein
VRDEGLGGRSRPTPHTNIARMKVPRKGEGGGKNNKEVARGDEEECTDGGVEQSTLSENERNRQRQTDKASEREIREIFC